ncbi:MAG: Fic family protein [Chitinispirillia bacterium]|nr:Fic family protein [Chitinispirillia bacterium]
MKYIHERENWTDFSWDWRQISPVLEQVRFKEGVLTGKLAIADDSARQDLMLNAISDELQKSYEIEGEALDIAKVRSSFANRLNISIRDKVYSGKDIDNFTDVLMDAVRNCSDEFTEERLFGWHRKMFGSGLYKMVVGGYRQNEMQVISGRYGRQQVHFHAPEPSVIEGEVQKFLNFVNNGNGDASGSMIKAVVAHLWFVTIHPFDDGNGRLARIITEMLLARGGAPYRYYSVSSQIMKERNAYYGILESTQKGDGEITEWIVWFLRCVEKSIAVAGDCADRVLKKALFWQKNASRPFNARQREMLNRLLDGSFEGKLTSAKWAKIGKCSVDTALRDINGLIAAGILAQDAGGSKNVRYLFVWGIDRG